MSLKVTILNYIKWKNSSDFCYLLQVLNVQILNFDLIQFPETGNSAVDSDTRVGTYSLIPTNSRYVQIRVLECT